MWSGFQLQTGAVCPPTHGESRSTTKLPSDLFVFDSTPRSWQGSPSQGRDLYKHQGLSPVVRVAWGLCSRVRSLCPSASPVAARAMTALRRAACRLQPALGWRSDGIPPAAAGILPLLGNPNQPVDAFALRAQRPQVHSSTEAPVSTASHQHCSTADPRCIPQATIRQRTHWGTIAASQEPAACFSIPRGTHGLQHSLRCLSASAVQLVSIRTAGQQRSASTSPCMVQWAGYSSSAAFVSEDGGGSFRTTAAGGEAGAAHGACLNLLHCYHVCLCL